MNVMFKGSDFELEHGRLKIRFSFQPIGGDIICTVTGGNPHLGAASLSEYYCKNRSHNSSISSLSVHGHQDKVVTDIMSGLIAKKLHCNVLVVAGIHYDDITREEIGNILDICREASNKFLDSQKE